MVYITTCKYLQELAAAKQVTSVVLFYESTDEVCVAHIASIPQGIPITYIEVENRDELLMMVGSCITQFAEQDIVVMDTSIPISKSFSARVSSGLPKVKSVQPRTRKTQPKKSTNKETTVETVSKSSVPAPQSVVPVSPASTSDVQLTSSDVMSELFKYIPAKALGKKSASDQEMALYLVLRDVELNEDDAALEQVIKSMKNGKLLWDSMKPNLGRIRELMTKL